jgi:hypothetical protein
LLEKVPAYPGLLVAASKMNSTGMPAWMIVEVKFTLTDFPATWHGTGVGGAVAPHVAALAAPLTTGTFGVTSKVEVTRFPLEPAAANEGEVLVAPAVRRPFDP